MKEHVFIRDRRSPLPKSVSVSRVMSANKAKNTKPELLLRRSLSAAGVRGYRLHSNVIPGHPDIVFVGKKVAIFVHGCYWHHCPKCNLPIPKHNQAFWFEKFTRNRERDKEKISLLRKNGWTPIVVWEHELKRSQEKIVQKIISRIH